MLTMQATGRVIPNFAYAHFKASEQFSKHVTEIENQNSGQPFGPFFEDIRTYCAASIICAAASLEALINELYLSPGVLRNQIPDFETFFWGGEIRVRKFLFFYGTKPIRGLEREPALRKYKKASAILNKPSLSKSDPEYQNAETLIGLRNYFIHYKPLWDKERRNTSLEAALAGQFPTSPFPDAGADFISMKCMSAGCASWCVTTARNFIEYFGSRTQVFPKKLNAFIK